MSPMTIDYKAKAKPNETSISMARRTLYAVLGFIALICFALFISLRTAPTTASMPVPLQQPVDTEVHTTSTEWLAAVDDDPLPHQAAQSTEDEAAEKETGVWQNVTVQRADTLSRIFHRLGLSTKPVRNLITTNASAKHLDNLKPGQTLKIRSIDHQVAELSLTLSAGHTLEAHKTDAGFEVQEKIIPLEKRLAFGKGEIRDSLFSSGKRVGLDQNLLAQLVEIFGWNIDFSLDLKPHDTFRVLYEEKCLDGARIKTGAILAAEIVNRGKPYQAVRYTDRSGHTSYFSPDGYGMHQAFLRTPVNFTRISSHFGPRNHPILHKMRQHQGVDYAAPHGAPVQATADGKVVFVGSRGGYGKAIELQHGARYSTFYAHLSRLPGNLRAGSAVKQGQVIGFVGRTGLATNPHLHYEFRVDGIHRNPLTVSLPRKSPIADSQKPQFIAHAKKMIKLLNMHKYKISVAAGAGDYPLHE
ncbi:MAG: peptidoglycan DD-metalloendopeptidase family protein [Gammaproteobacteria bacterium]|nr:peptidoglycan DD-metalloendopeptidase family protein [Gammaproteobacteria bacterium]